MKIMQTLEGGLRCDIEDEDDWHLLQSITNDAISCDEKLAQRLGNLITDPDVAPDWEEFIIPDLEEIFSADVQHVATAIASARLDSGGGPGPLWIKREDGFHWYSALNQARLAIEERFRFGPEEDVDPDELSPARRAAFIRTEIYSDIQRMLLHRVMR